MALYDNKHWFLSHIRNSFISSDDTGMCEAVIIDDIPKHSALFSEYEKFPNADESVDDDDNNSLDIHTDADFGRPRLCTNTAQRLAKMEQDMKKAALTRHVKWEEAPKSKDLETDVENTPLFEKKEIKPRSGPFKSLLSLQLEKCPVLPRNPFIEYAKFGGNVQSGMPTRTYKVFLTMLTTSERNYPLTVCVLGSAKVSQLIGYVCWKYVSENSDFQFKENVASYGLFIAEDDGEVDWDFSCLDPKETVGKFGLTYLALVELPENQKGKDNNETSNADLPGPLIRRTPELSPEDEEWIKIKGDLTAIEALVYQSFPVQMINKMRPRVDVILGINGDKMEVDPAVTNTKVAGKMWRQKSASYDMDDIVFCDLLEAKASGKTAFRVVRRAAEMEEVGSFPRSTVPSAGTVVFKNVDFEAEHKIAEEIVRKVNLILHLKCSVYRKEYLTQKDKKLRRRRSFSIWPR